MRNRLKPITILIVLLTSACAREALYALPIEEESPPEEEVVEEEQTPEEIPEPEIEPEPEVTPEEPEVEPAPEVTPEDPEVEPEPEAVPPPPADDCDETSDLLYAVDKGNGGLYLFDPLTGAFELLGIPDCGMFSGTPASMAVARDGVAYVRYSSSTLYAVDLQTLHCVETDMAVSSFGKFGMGYATLHGNTWQDELFIANRNTLAKLNTDTFEVETLGSLPASQSSPATQEANSLGSFHSRHQRKSWSSIVTPASP